MKYLFILGTIVFTVYGQIILKWRLNKIGEFPEKIWDKLIFALKAYTDFWILSGFFAAILASVCWILALSKFDLSFAYPFMSISFILVLVLSGLFLNEQITLFKVVGLLLIIAGILISVKSL